MEKKGLDIRTVHWGEEWISTAVIDNETIEEGKGKSKQDSIRNLLNKLAIQSNEITNLIHLAIEKL